MIEQKYISQLHAHQVKISDNRLMRYLDSVVDYPLFLILYTPTCLGSYPHSLQALDFTPFKEKALYTLDHDDVKQSIDFVGIFDITGRNTILSILRCT